MVKLLIAATVALLAAVAAQAEPVDVQAFPGGVTLQTKNDEMTDECVCTLFTAMRQGVQMTANADGVAVWTKDDIHVNSTPAPLLRLGDAPPFTLEVPQRPHLMIVPPEHVQATRDALYSGTQIRIRFADWPRGDSHNGDIVNSDWAAGYERAVALCDWERSSVMPATFAPKSAIWPQKDGSVRAEFGGADGWTVMYLVSFKTCEIAGDGGLTALYAARKGKPDKVSALRNVEFKHPSGVVVVGFSHTSFSPTSLDEILAGAAKAGPAGSVHADFKDFSLFGFNEAIAFAEQTCKLKLTRN